MAFFTKESLENLRRRVDLVDLLSSHIELKAAGASYKALCPFHDEKSPSFTVQRGAAHYHCFGCGAHGDAIQFLVEYQRMSFQEAVESLAQRYGVLLERVEEARAHKGPPRARLKEALDLASRLYHYLLLHTEEGHQALGYLYERGMDLEFIKTFQLGLASKNPGILRKALAKKGIEESILASAGLLKRRDDGSWREFFYDRITFPIRDAGGAVIGFSARKYREETFGGKYVNSTETDLFKKSYVLYGLSYCRRRIAKERRAIIVEGQVDALRLIHGGLNLAVAALGTAFGQEHVRELVNLGVERIFLAMDADKAGLEAARKVGDLFQRQGIEVRVVEMSEGADPDSLVQLEGIDHFIELLEKADDYLSWLVRRQQKERDMSSPAAKAQLVHQLAVQIREWDNPVMVHESLRKLARLLGVPEEMVSTARLSASQYMIKKNASAGPTEVDGDKILEADLLRWLLLAGEQTGTFVDLVQQYLTEDDFHNPTCRSVFRSLMELFTEGGSYDMLSIASHTEDPYAQKLLDHIVHKKVDRSRASQHLEHTIEKLLERNWLQNCEAVRLKMEASQNEEERLLLLKEFAALRNKRPSVRMYG